MTTAPPPGPEEDTPAGQPVGASEAPLAASPDQPVLDSFAAEEPAAPADAATGAGTPVVDLPGAQPAPPTELAAAPAAAEIPRGSEGLTTAPARTPAAEPAPTAEPTTGHADLAASTVDPASPAAGDTTAGPVAAEPVQTLTPEPAATGAAASGRVTAQDPAVAAGYPLPAALTSADAPAATPRRGRAWLPLTAVGLAVALLAGATGWLAWQLRQQDRAAAASAEAVAAARDAARLLFSYDHKTLQADFDKGLAVTTGDFRTQYQRTTKDVVSPVAMQYKAVVKAEVVEAAVIDAQADSVTALVFLNQATTSTRVQGQQVDQSRVRMRLVERGGRWLVEEVKAL